MKTSTPTRPPERRDRLLREQVHDTYKQRGQLKEPTRCPGCGAVYRKGRWSWTAEADDNAGETEALLIIGDHTVHSTFADRIQPGGGLVKQNDLRIGHQRPGQGHPLFHSAG